MKVKEFIDMLQDSCNPDSELELIYMKDPDCLYSVVGDEVFIGWDMSMGTIDSNKPVRVYFSEIKVPTDK